MASGVGVPAAPPARAAAVEADAEDEEEEAAALGAGGLDAALFELLLELLQPTSASAPTPRAPADTPRTAVRRPILRCQ